MERIIESTPIPMTDSYAGIQQVCAAFASGVMDRGPFLERCTQLVVAEVGCSRAGIWVFRDTDRGRTLHCLALHDRGKGAMTMVSDATAGKHVAAYFQALEQVGYVMATDARVHYATAALFASHLEFNHVESVMAASFSVDGKLYGAITCTQVGRQMEWTRRQLDALRRIGACIGLALAANAARAEEGSDAADLSP